MLWHAHSAFTFVLRTSTRYGGSGLTSTVIQTSSVARCFSKDVSTTKPFQVKRIAVGRAHMNFLCPESRLPPCTSEMLKKEKGKVPSVVLVYMYR